MEVDVAVGGNLFPKNAINRFIVGDHGSVWELKFLVRSPIEDVDGAALVDEDFLNCVFFYFNGDDHRVILLVIEALKIVVCDENWLCGLWIGYGGGVSYWRRRWILH